MTVAWTLLDSPVGVLCLTASDAGVTGLEMEPHPPVSGDRVDDHPVLQPACEQLLAYFAGDLASFDLSLELAGTAFQRRVWSMLLTIPLGMTTTYGALAARLGKPGAMRAVGLANGRNPISIIVPCHRVIGADGSLTGYGGGIERKRWLLTHEQAVLASSGARSV